MKKKVLFGSAFGFICFFGGFLASSSTMAEIQCGNECRKAAFKEGYVKGLQDSYAKISEKNSVMLEEIHNKAEKVRSSF